MMRFRSAFFVLIPSDLCHRGRPHPLRLAVIILFFLLWLLPEDERKRLPVDRRGLGRRILGVFGSCSMVRGMPPYAARQP